MKPIACCRNGCLRLCAAIPRTWRNTVLMSVLRISQGCNALSRARIRRLRPGSNRRSTWNSGLPFPWAWRRRKSWQRSAPNGRNLRGSPAFPAGTIHRYLGRLPVAHVWGIGAKTSAYLAKYGISTALAFATAAGTLGSSAFGQTLLRDLAGVTGYECVHLGDTGKGGLSVCPEIQDFLTPLERSRVRVFPVGEEH